MIETSWLIALYSYTLESNAFQQQIITYCSVMYRCMSLILWCVCGTHQTHHSSSSSSSSSGNPWETNKILKKIIS